MRTGVGVEASRGRGFLGRATTSGAPNQKQWHGTISREGVFYNEIVFVL